MAFNIQSFSRISGSANNTISTLSNATIVGAPNFFSYVSITDNLATIQTIGYFNNQAREMNVGDTIYVVGSNGIEFTVVNSISLNPDVVSITPFTVTTGVVSGPVSSTDNALARWDGATGTILQNSNATLTDAGVLTLANLTPSKVVISDAARQLISSVVTSNELDSLINVTGNVQAQIDALANVDNDFTVTQNSHGFIAGDVLYLVGIVYTKAIATSSITAEVVGIVKSATTNTFVIAFGGRITGLPAMTAGVPQYLSTVTAGTLSATRPVAIGQVVKPVLISDTANSGIWVNQLGVLL